ncbi:MAG TPA: HlyD family efflux transporter periplasmic adaptor subunit [Anaerolineales bacterium]|nr:HlyD family efflux transporter periplasmic adaptor subunit [Anaerolineales bacterium]
MRSKLFLSILVILLLSACAGGANASTAIPTVMLAGNPASTPAPSLGSGSGVTASGIIVDNQEAHMAFSMAGNVKLVNVAFGDQVKAGQVLVQLDDTTQQTQLDQATLALDELTSPQAIANAKLTVTTAQTDVTNAQTALNNELYWQNTALIQNYYANYVIAKDNLDKAQTAYDAAHVGEYINNANEAAAYNRLYVAQQAFNTAQYYYSLYSQAPTQNQMDKAKATLELANAALKNAKDYLAALTSGSVPAGATGPDMLVLQQAKLAVQTAQQNLDATRLVAPFSGEVASVQVSAGDYVIPAQVVLVLSDTSHMHVETTDLSERDVPKVKPGQAATVTVKALNQDLTGKVGAISPTADSLGGDVVYKVTIILDTLPPNLLAGMSVNVEFDTGQ